MSDISDYKNFILKAVKDNDIPQLKQCLRELKKNKELFLYTYTPEKSKKISKKVRNREYSHISSSYLEKMLEVAVKLNHTDIVKFLINEYKVDPGTHIYCTNNALKAALENSEELLEFLLLSGANPNENAGTIVRLPLGWAIEYHNEGKVGGASIIEMLLKYGANLNLDSPAKGFPLVHTRDNNVVKLFIKRGADVNACDSGMCKENVLINCLRQDISKLEMLLINGADVHYIAKYGEQAIHNSVYTGDVTKVQLLIEYGANPYLAIEDTPSARELFLKKYPERIQEFDDAVVSAQGVVTAQHRTIVESISKVFERSHFGGLPLDLANIVAEYFGPYRTGDRGALFLLQALPEPMEVEESSEMASESSASSTPFQVIKSLKRAREDSGESDAKRTKLGATETLEISIDEQQASGIYGHNPQLKHDVVELISTLKTASDAMHDTSFYGYLMDKVAGYSQNLIETMVNIVSPEAQTDRDINFMSFLLAALDNAQQSGQFSVLPFSNRNPGFPEDGPDYGGGYDGAKNNAEPKISFMGSSNSTTETWI